MSKTFIQVFKSGHWQRAARLEEKGVNQCSIEYLDEYVFSENPVPLSLNFPVEMDAFRKRRVSGYDMPAFLYDLAPQGRGRALLKKELKIKGDSVNELPLIFAGAFNPIGRLRLESSVEFFSEYAKKRAQGGEWNTGFSFEDILEKSENFLESMSVYAMLASGTTGAQGVAPKFLLAKGRDGLWYPDMALADEDSEEHWLLKLPRGRAEEDRVVVTLPTP